MKKCEKCDSFYDENANSSCPYCTVEITGGQGFFNKTNLSDKSADKTEVWNDKASNDIEKTEVYTPPNKSVEIDSIKPMEITKDNLNMRNNIETNVSDSKADVTILVGENKDNDIQLLVGWLVIIEGKGKGHDLRVESGQNSIGRYKSNMISIDFGDETISREKHAFIIYDPKHKKFMFKNGEGQNISYLNDEGVYSPVAIKDGDIVEIGETKLRFTQLCNDNFQW